MKEMKHLLLVALVSLLFVSCQEEFPRLGATGTLVFESIEVAASSNETLSRSIDTDLMVDICQDGKVVELDGQQLHFTDGEYPATLYLPAGTYQVKAYNETYLNASKWTNEELGDKVYYIEENVQVSEGKVAKMNLQVPMANIGVTFSLPENFNASFKDYSFTITKADEAASAEATEESATVRTVTITKPHEVVYMNAEAFKVTLKATNADDEAVEASYTHSEVAAGTIYTVAYEVAQTVSSRVLTNP